MLVCSKIWTKIIRQERSQRENKLLWTWIQLVTLQNESRHACCVTGSSDRRLKESCLFRGRKVKAFCQTGVFSCWCKVELSSAALPYFSTWLYLTFFRNISPQAKIYKNYQDHHLHLCVPDKTVQHEWNVSIICQFKRWEEFDILPTVLRPKPDGLLSLIGCRAPRHSFASGTILLDIFTYCQYSSCVEHEHRLDTCTRLLKN